MQQALPDLPPWLIWLAGAAGVFVSVLVGRLGLIKGASGLALPEKPANVAAVVVDTESLHRLTASIEGHTFAVTKGYSLVGDLVAHHEKIVVQLTRLCGILDDKHREQVEDRLEEIDAKLDALGSPKTSPPRRR